MKTKGRDSNTIISKLKAIGIGNAYIKKIVLPDWWDNDILKSESGYQEYAIHIAKKLGLSLSDLLSDHAISFPEPNKILFKASKNQKKERFQFFIKLGFEIGKKYLQHSESNLHLPTSAKEVRDSFSSDFPLTLINLLSYFKKIGIPVIPLFQLPNKQSSPHGMVFAINNRPVICIGGKRQFSSFQIFTLLHELGHIVSGHIKSEFSPILDIEMNKDLKDEAEIEANRFAMEVFTGEPNYEVQLYNNQDAKSFAESCRAEGKLRNLDPGFLATNYGWGNPKFWPKVYAALKELEEGNALGVLQNEFLLSWDREIIGDDYFDFVKKVSSI